MRTVLLSSLRTHTRRFVAAALAVVIGVAFIVATGVLSSATKDGMVGSVRVPYENADLVVAGLDGDQAAELVELGRARGEAAGVLGWTMQPVAEDGLRVSDRVEVGPLADADDLRWQLLREGAFPDGAGEAVADVNAAKSDGFEVGDRLRVGSGSRAADVTVVGLVDTPSASAGADLYLTWDDLAPFAGSLYVDSVAYDVQGSPDSRIRALERATGATVQPVDEFVVERQAEITRDVDIVAVVLLVFASIALFVAVLVIANTFSILFAQRARDFALLRCVGATRRQVLRSVRVEALVLGVVAAAVGVLAGIGTGHLLAGVARRLISDVAIGDPDLSLGWTLGGFAVGVVATLVASWVPTRRAVEVGPLEALRPVGAVDVRTRAGLVRIALGALALLAGGGALAYAVAEHVLPPMLVGGAATFTGVLLLGPLLVPPLVRLVGRVAGHVLGAPGRLAAANAVRNPRRTAATTASLLVGVTLTTAVLTGMASSRTAVDDEMELAHPVDLTLTATDEPLPSALLDDVRSTDGVAAATSLAGTRGELSGGIGELPLLAVDGDDLESVVHGDSAVVVPGPGQVMVPWDSLGADQDGGDKVRVTADGTTTVLRIRGGEGWGAAALVAPATYRAITGTDPDDAGAVWVRADAGADPEDLAGDLDALGAPVRAELANGLGERDWVYQQLDILTGSVVALLGIAVVIALVGIGNTLGLSVLERSREHALLRALGLTRRQLRSLLGAEAVLLSVTAALLGTALGIGYAWVGLRAVVQPAVQGVTLELPLLQLAAVVLVAGVAGLLACVLPARRAARTTPAAGLALE